MTLVVKKIDERKLRALKAEAARRGITISQAVEEAIDLWLTFTTRSALDEEEEANNREYERLKRAGELERMKGRYVVIAGGRLIGAFESLSEASEALRKLGVRRALIFRPGIDDAGVRREWLGGSMRRTTA